ncbi:MAG TPA: hypothetical protein VFP72_04975 [Kineosporiaceae bacterium]|nr:hypothetical protein [Kineosporiaceae bacterium]
MNGWGADGDVPGPLLALAVVAVLMVLLRWAFGRGRSVVMRRPTSGRHDEYGLLVRVAAPATVEDGERIRRRLVAAGLRATLAPTLEGPAVMVFPEDVTTARGLIDHPPPGPPPAP